MLPTDPPGPTEVEVSVFGRGYGESLCIHFGKGEWAVIDSCINPLSRAPASLTYLDSLGLSPEGSIKLVAATHWDDDHIRGIADVVAASPIAAVACSGALARKEWLAFVIEQDNNRGALGSGVSEFARLLQLCVNAGRQIVWAKSSVALFPSTLGSAVKLTALSPSDNVFERSLQALVEQATQQKSSLARRYRAPEGPNGASVAMWLRIGNVVALLGADLEASNNPDAGWGAVVANAGPSEKASFVKVPHHGSEDAHHEGMWTVLLGPSPVAAVTPWSNGRHYLPRESDIERLHLLAGQGYLTAMPALGRSKDRRAEVERLIRRLHSGQLKQPRGWGHVRARRAPGDTNWRVELFGDARPL